MDKQAFCHWISVNDALPDAGDRVIATDGDFVGEAYMVKRAGNSPNWMRHYGCSWVGGDVIAWTPMPLYDLGRKNAYRPVSQEHCESVGYGVAGSSFLSKMFAPIPHLLEMPPPGGIRFCPICGASLTDEAVKMARWRLEAMRG